MAGADGCGPRPVREELNSEPIRDAIRGRPKRLLDGRSCYRARSKRRNARRFSQVDPHRRAEERSLALHEAVGARLADDPAALALARERVGEWLRTGSVHVDYARAWSEILARPVVEIRELLARDDERMRALRQVTPFAGVLDARTRWRIWRAAGGAA
jgi:hypothetical protein